MKLVIQRVTEASVRVEGDVVGKIDRGFMVLVGIGADDTKQIAERYIEKMVKMRIFEDENGKTNLSLADVDGQILMISQFTLYANCRKGNRPSFIDAGGPDMAEELYEYMLEKTKQYVPVVEKGIFGAEMEVSLINDGPFTIVLDEHLFD